ncbi:hypothetical protein [Acaryochloris sp. CCMEE 5410]|uniref:hypothetical protein n=1 Tax=Acaryochloris sp. CCMEE 5410 TaxID=310037 RepID=UPI000248514B|nr:hypothetical protein [Acaryochloris sp. CCMEE 5410]KAI9130122.1 hypothetical protein ON05_031335 [Acaryochloris sp. CCMEE 5410]
MDFQLSYVWPDEQFTTIRVDAAVACGKRFEGVAYILQPLSKNPSLQIPNGLGIRSTQQILDRISQGFEIPEISKEERQ